MSFKTSSFVSEWISRPERMVVPHIFIAAFPVGSTLGFSCDLQQQNNVLDME